MAQSDSPTGLKLKEAKRLQKVYVKQGVTECYCSQNSSSECPMHISTYIKSLEWGSNDGDSNDNSNDKKRR